MERLPNLWIPLVTYVLGLISGVIVDRAIGGPGGLTLGLLILLVPGTLAFVGPLAQQYWGNRFSTEARNRELFREHAALLLERVLWPVSSAALNYDVEGWPDGHQGEYEIRVPVGNGQFVPMVTLVQWPQARAHMLVDPVVGPLLSEVEKRRLAGKAQKRAMDERFAAVIESTLRTQLGIEFIAAQGVEGWSTHPTQSMWYPDQLVRRLRQRIVAEPLEVRDTAYSYSTGEPPLPVQQVCFGGPQVLQVLSPQRADPAQFRAAYEQLRSDRTEQEAVTRAKATAADDGARAAEFAAAVRIYAESVEASEKHLLGDCPGCSHLHPR